MKGDAQALAEFEVVRYKAIVKEKFQARIPKNRISTTTRDTSPLVAVLFLKQLSPSIPAASRLTISTIWQAGGAEVPPTYHQLELTITNTAFSSIKKEPLITK